MTRSDYQAERDAGRDAVEVFRTMQTDGLGTVEALRNIRERFGLSLVEAKEVIRQFDGHQATFGRIWAPRPPDPASGIAGLNG